MSPKLLVPELTKPSRPKRIATKERTLRSGLRVVAVRRASVPMVEVRLRVPFFSTKPTHLARATLLADTILTGAAEHDRLGLAIAQGELGGQISVGLDADRLLLSASALSGRLPALLRLLNEVVTSATYPAREVAGERERLIERITIARSQPGVIANEALAARIAGGHPYGSALPDAESVAASTAAQLRALHREFVRPSAATLVIVGDVTPGRALDAAERALSGWQGERGDGRLQPPPQVVQRPLQIVDRPGSVQTSLRFAGPALARDDERYPALQLANLAFGGYFSSRWVENIREDKGYSYSPRSGLDHAALRSTLTIAADVATEVTAAAVLETLYELGRIAALPVTETELSSVRQYAIGSMALSTATQAGLASTLSALLAAGLDAEWLTTHPARLAEVTLDDLAAAAAQFLAPRGFAGVAVGDRSAIAGSLAGLIEIE